MITTILAVIGLIGLAYIGISVAIIVALDGPDTGHGGCM